MTRPDPQPEIDAVPIVPLADLGGSAAALELLTHGELDVVGRLVEASNATLFCAVTLDGITAACAHKPVAGESPLWDFPDGTLAAREVAAYRVSARTGWDLVPPTVLREGPWGPGMCQLWVEVDDAVDRLALVRSDDDRLRRVAVFDVVVNNADRKGGHLLPTADGQILGIDHGLCFAVEDKLRTLLWGWADAPLSPEAIDVLTPLAAQFEAMLALELAPLLTRAEIAATRARIDDLLRAGVHPAPRQRGYPVVPWPPF